MSLADTAANDRVPREAVKTFAASVRRMETLLDKDLSKLCTVECST